MSALNAVQYLTIPLVYVWKFTVIAFVLWVGCFMFGYKVTYSNCWSIVLISEFIFVLPELIKIGWFILIETDPSYYAVKMFYPLSAINFVSYAEIDPRYIYPLKALNVFELGYWMALVYGVHSFAKKQWKIAAFIVGGSYVVLFLLWLGFYVIVYN